MSAGGGGGRRVPLSAQTRFEVFKRDAFACVYCGRKAPDVILHVDHIVPVSQGGTNDMLNLVTACQDCNLGKGARKLQDGSVLARQRRELALRQERLEQIQMMGQWQREMLEARQAELREVNGLLLAMGFWETPPVRRFLAEDAAGLLRRFGLARVLASLQEAFETSRTPEAAVRKVRRLCTGRTKRQTRLERSAASLVRLAESRFEGVEKPELMDILRFGMKQGGREFIRDARRLLLRSRNACWNDVRNEIFLLAADDGMVDGGWD